MKAREEPIQSIRSFSPDQRFRIAQAAVAHENLMRPDANIRILDSKDLEQYLHEKEPLQSQEEHEVLIIRNQEHYLTVDLLRTRDTASCVLLDAANDYRIYKIATTFQEHGFETHYATGMSFNLDENIQHDRFNCSMFALDHAIQLSHTSSEALHSNVKQHSVEGLFQWDCLPAAMLRNTQSVSVLNQYLRANPDAVNETMPHGFDMKSYLRQGTIRTPEGKMRNNSINSHVFQDAHRAFEKMRILEAMDKTIKKMHALEKRFNKKTPRLQALIDARDRFAQNNAPDVLNSPDVQVFQGSSEPETPKESTKKKPVMSTALFKMELRKLRDNPETGSNKENKTPPTGLTR